MIFHLILNSFFVFLTLAALVEVSLYLFKVKNGRARYLCRLIPLFKIPFDLCIFGVLGESFLINLNPLSCEIYVKSLFNIDSATPLPQYIASQFQPLYIHLFVAGVIATSALLFSYKSIRLILSTLYLRKVLSQSAPCKRPISSPLIQSELKRLNGVILTCDQVQIPFAAGSHSIVFPTALLSHLSQDEFEAVVAHELEHLKWRDPVLRYISNVVCSLFWWIPTGWWSKRLEEDQELASDLGTPKYGIDACALGSAFLKAIQQERVGNLKSAAICPFVSPKNTHAKRLENMLNQPSKGKPLISGIGIALCLMACLCFWMC
jgi:beta-lactamase regulating signal transducer with metallopeptidase domain